MGNRFVLIIAACAVLFFGLLIFNKKDTATTNTAVSPSNHTQGTGDVLLVEYGDFECPGCGAYYPVLKQVKAKYGDKITFQFRNFPLTSLHPNAMAAHRAAEAADKQGKFWEMHDLLYEGQRTWAAQTGVKADAASTIFEGYAQQLNLNIEQFNADRNGSAVNDIIQADIKAGGELNVSSTPTFILDGTKLEDSRDTVEYFSEKIDAALAAKNQQ
jgi:protein-disulfide isomerase